MPGPKPSFTPRMSGGFNPGMGAANEHLDESAFQAAAQQKGLTQQGAAAPPALSGSDPVGGGAFPGTAGTAGAGQQVKPRPVGTLTEELVKRPAQDIVKGLASIFDLNEMLGLPPSEDDPQTKAKKQQMLQRYNKLTEEQQAIARQKYQEDLKKKQAEEQEKQARQQQAEAAKAQTVEMPSSGAQKGPQGPGGSKKQKAVNKLQHDRKTLGGPKSSN